MRPDQNQEFRRIMRDLMIPRILSGQKFGNFKEDGWECKFYTAKKNQNQMVIEVTFLGEWSAMHFRGFCPDSFLSELPMFAKYGVSNYATEPEPVRRRDTVKVFCKRNAVQAWARLQESKRLKAQGTSLSDRELTRAALRHGCEFGFADEDGEIPTLARLSDVEGVQFAAVKHGVGYVFEVDPVTGAVESKRNRAYDQLAVGGDQLAVSEEIAA